MKLNTDIMSDYELLSMVIQIFIFSMPSLERFNRSDEKRHKKAATSGPRSSSC